MRIYVASSWRNTLQPAVVVELRRAGHEVYDFRNPGPGSCGFAWSQIDADWLQWTPRTFVEALKHPVAKHGFGDDKNGLDWCDACVLVLPCGRSAHLEAGYAIGKGKQTYFLLHPDKFEPELMYLLGDGFAHDIPSLIKLLLYPRQPQSKDERWAQLDREKKLEMLAAGGRADIARRDGKDFPAGGSR